MKVQKINQKNLNTNDVKYKRKRKHKKRFVFLKIVLFAVIISAATIFIGLSSVFNISKIQVNGIKHCSESDIINATGISLGSNGFKAIGGNIKDLFMLRYGKAEERILKNFPYAESVRVSFHLPDKIVVSVKERIPFGIVNSFGTKLIIDSSGYVLEEKQNSKIPIPVLKGLNIEKSEIGQVMKYGNKEGLKLAVKLLNQIQITDKGSDTKLLKLVKSLDVSDTSKIRLFVDSRINVNFGDLYNLKYNLDFFREIYSRDLQNQGKGNLDMTIKTPTLN